MNWAQFKDPVSHVWLSGTVVACWFVAQEVVGLNTHFLQKYFSSSTDSVCRFYGIHLRKTLLGPIANCQEANLQQKRSLLFTL